MARGAGLRPKAKGLDKPPDPTVRAPVPDPTIKNSIAMNIWWGLGTRNGGEVISADSY